jgi:hypothetical protein
MLARADTRGVVVGNPAKVAATSLEAAGAEVALQSRRLHLAVGLAKLLAHFCAGRGP